MPASFVSPNLSSPFAVRTMLEQAAAAASAPNENDSASGDVRGIPGDPSCHVSNVVSMPRPPPVTTPPQSAADPRFGEIYGVPRGPVAPSLLRPCCHAPLFAPVVAAARQAADNQPPPLPPAIVPERSARAISTPSAAPPTGTGPPTGTVARLAGSKRKRDC